jgi:myo-inositol-1(or 4)-monophosphatase
VSESAVEVSPRELLDLALEAARAAAALVAERAEQGVSVAATKSTATDPVTEADRASEELIRQTILARRPHDAFLGEEGDDVAGTSGVRWVVDPIDGTVNFLYGIPRYAVSVAAEVDGGIVAGVVVDVARQVEYTAYRDGAVVIARRNGEALRVRGEAPLAQRLVATGFGYSAQVRRLQGQALVRLLPRVRDIRRAGSCALDICSVADGSVDGYFEEGVHLWDYAAATLVAEGAGARWRLENGLGGGELVICAPGHGLAELREAVAEAGFIV